LAEAIVNPTNPLTARVFVNRVWLHHFGAALVRTPSDFGLRSDPPTHPELLDYLAARFVQDGWSIKNLHRLIMLSSVYQQSSDNNARSSKIDADNRLLWRMNRQRLDFEAMRDTLLAVAGRLDLTPGGHSVDITTEPFSPRRTVYAYIDRQNLPGLFRTFDFASPDATSPQRFFTTVPQQALFLMNSPFVVQQAQRVVDPHQFSSAGSQPERVRRLYKQLFQREPTREELRLADQFLASQQEEQKKPPHMVPVWQYGYGEFDEASARIQNFAPLPHFTGAEVQGGPVLPDPKLGWVMLNRSGGHVGNDSKHAAIRRWIAPQDGSLNIKGILRHDSSKGDGVRGRIVSSQLGKLGEWEVQDGKTTTKLDQVQVSRGDTIDFITDCKQTVENDSFDWEATISLASEPEKTLDAKSWDTKSDFASSARPSAKPLTPWEKYAQVLLLANELAFVD
jgi:hypothetical protein